MREYISPQIENAYTAGYSKICTDSLSAACSSGEDSNGAAKFIIMARANPTQFKILKKNWSLSLVGLRFGYGVIPMS